MAEPELTNQVSLLLCGDVMAGRGIDQILACPGSWQLHEPHVVDARLYVEFAEEAGGAIPRPVESSYIWGPLAEEFRRAPDQVNLINLETAVTTSDDFFPGKAVHYRMNPKNIGCLTEARIDCCALANNHILDWGIGGLRETLETLDRAGVKHAGAGLTLAAAEAPAILDAGIGRRVLVFGIGSWTSGIPSSWAASERRPGVNLLESRSGWISRLRDQVREIRMPGDVVVVSIHWGGNWEDSVPEAERELAHRLVDEAGVDVIHGHSSHHVQGIEVYRERLILYGSGDLINDYEGIGGHEAFRPDLGLLYSARLDDSTGRLQELRMIPVRRARFQLHRASAPDAEWIQELLNREGEPWGTEAERDAEDRLRLRWK